MMTLTWGTVLLSLAALVIAFGLCVLFALLMERLSR